MKNFFFLPQGETNFDAAPWKGTLRHIKVKKKKVRALNCNESESILFVKVEKVNKPHRITQFKKYPDEDAPNPYQENKGES